MWAFFKRIGVIGSDNKPSSNFGQPKQIYLQYCRAKGDQRSEESILAEGEAALARVRKRGVPIAEGYGEKTWQLQPELDQEIRELYKDAKYCLWTEWESTYLKSIENAIVISSSLPTEWITFIILQAVNGLMVKALKFFKNCENLLKR
jgi:ethanolamine ammonia-lyase large subunit